MTLAQHLRRVGIIVFLLLVAVGMFVGNQRPAQAAHELPPTADEILGEKCYPSLLDLPLELKKEIRIIDIFRPSEEVGQIVAQVIKLKHETGQNYVIWAQLGIRDDVAAGVAKADGLEMIQDRCIKIEYNKLFP